MDKRPKEIKTDKETRSRLAVASSDGIVVNRHFGHADKFYIYELDNGLKLIEVRDVVPVCEAGNHDADKLRKNAEVISDCDYLLVSKIGDGAARVVESFGTDPYEIPGIIKESVEELIKFIKLKALFE